jgi:hypothetical protein
MPIQEYVCSRKHLTMKMVSLAKSPGPKFVKCPVHLSTTHSPGCSKIHGCGLRATRREVYRVSVGGDLPTRSAF